MRATTRTAQAIPADKITSIIGFLDSSLRDAEAEAGKAKGDNEARAFYLGRRTAFMLTLDLLREAICCARWAK
ncbi:MAG: hypothetical protein JNK52_15420 [Zoogloeaceae bacterium]|nr:hypothetical protein [Zoogloeaceae bacterium]